MCITSLFRLYIFRVDRDHENEVCTINIRIHYNVIYNNNNNSIIYHTGRAGPSPLVVYYHIFVPLAVIRVKWKKGELPDVHTHTNADNK